MTTDYTNQNKTTGIDFTEAEQKQLANVKKIKPVLKVVGFLLLVSAALIYFVLAPFLNLDEKAKLVLSSALFFGGIVDISMAKILEKLTLQGIIAKRNQK